MRTKSLLLLALLPALLLAPAAAHGDGFDNPGGPTTNEGLRTASAAADGVENERYRFVSLTPRVHPSLTVIEKIDKRDAAVDRWWHLRGVFVVPAVGDDNSPSGLSADGDTLVLASFPSTYPPKKSRFVVVDTRTSRHAVTRLTMPGAYGFYAISPDGSRIYLIHYFYEGVRVVDYELRALDTSTGRLLPKPIVDPMSPKARIDATPITREQSPDGRWSYTLYGADTPFLEALDTVRGRSVHVDLPRLPGGKASFDLQTEMSDDGKEILVSSRDTGKSPGGPMLTIDTKTLQVRRLDQDPLAFLHAFPGPGIRTKTLGRSTEGRRIELRQLGDPKWSGELLVFGCIHGDECAGRGLEPVSGSLTAGCPDRYSDVYVVPDLDPDGSAAGSRLNASGVDLNRNFPSEWQAIGGRGDPEFSGPRPFSEPETRLAARAIRALRPAATIWFHQYRGERPFVRAWGPSLAAGRHFAALARVPFRAMRWPAGTAPNWQNHEQRGAAFVVELPAGALQTRMRERLSTALVRMGRSVREDRDGRKG